MIGTKANCDDGASATYLGSFSAAETEHWYKAQVTVGQKFAFDCETDPNVSVVAGSSESLETCVFLACVSGTTTIACSQGSPASAPNGMKGCCGKGASMAKLTCPNPSQPDGGPFPPQAGAYLVVRRPTSGSCSQYALTVSHW